LDLCEEMTAASDTFVSVRVGDYQKLSRLAASRTYRFPQAGDRQYGKIEVFKRIGATAVSIDPLSDDLRKVDVKCSDSSIGNLGFKVAVGCDESSKKKMKTARAAEAAEAGEKAMMAKEYLSKHCLEVRLSEAMQALLRERPENPTQFLADKLLSSDGMGGTLIAGPLSPTVSPKTAQAPGRDTSALAKKAPASKWSPSKGPFQQMPAAAFMGMHGKFAGFKAARKKAAPVSNWSPSKGPFQQMPAAAFTGIFGKFGGSKEAQKKTVVKWSPSKGPFQQMPEAAFTGIFGKFAGYKQAQKNTMVKWSPSKGPFQQMAAATFKGMWGKFKGFKAAEQKVLNAAPPNPTFQFNPSVGTWIMKPKPTKPEAPKPEVAALKPLWLQAPSCGTWLAKPQPVIVAPETQSYQFRPSVGSWLVPIIVEEEVAPAKHKGMIVGLGSMYGPMFHGGGIRII